MGRGKPVELQKFRSMTDHPKQDPWALLASQLGTPPPPKKKSPEERAQQQDPAQGQGAEDKGAGAARPPKRQAPAVERPRPAADWGAVASQLGLSPPPKPERAAPEPADRPTGASAARPAAPQVRTEPAMVKLFEEPAEFVETPVELVEPASDEEARLGPAPEWDEVRDQPFGVGIEPEERQSARQQSRAASDDRAAAESPSGEGQSPARSKRRRRRRPARKKEGSETGAGPAAELAAEPEADLIEPDDGDDDEFAVDDTGDQGQRRQRSAKDARDLKASHRGVPTWKEAIELLIAANLDSRAKRPERPNPSRGRGGRNRGGRNQKRGN